ncbi:MAG: DUF6261 family protein [Tannerellaceae bacterium]|jgi:hypothetical protein|nr:DUF6261 family protein [Tannerellaceae bacterium]
MKKLISIRFRDLLRKLYNGEHSGFYDRQIYILGSIISRLPQLEGLYLDLKAVFKREEDVFKKNEGSLLTPDIAKLAEMITAYFSYFKHSVDIVRFSKNNSELNAMSKLLFLINTYADIMTAGYTDMSGMADVFLENCDDPEYKPSVELLGLSAQVTRMRAAHASFTSLYNTRSLNREHIAELGRLRDIRPEVDDAFASLVDGVNVAWITNEIGAKDANLGEALIEAKEMIVGLIRQMKIEVAHRGKKRKRSAHKEAEAATTVEPAPPSHPATDEKPAGGN